VTPASTRSGPLRLGRVAAAARADLRARRGGYTRTRRPVGRFGRRWHKQETHHARQPAPRAAPRAVVLRPPRRHPGHRRQPGRHRRQEQHEPDDVGLAPGFPRTSSSP